MASAEQRNPANQHAGDNSIGDAHEDHAPEDGQQALSTLTAAHEGYVEIAISAWLHAKRELSQSRKTALVYQATITAFRALLLDRGLDLDAADPRRVRDIIAVRRMTSLTVSETPESSAPPNVARTFSPSISGLDTFEPILSSAEPEAEAFRLAAEVEQLQAERTRLLALAAQAFAAQPAQSRYGERPVSAATFNLRLAALSSFYAYALQQDLLRGPNPIQRITRRTVRAYEAAHPLAYEDLRERLAMIDQGTPAGLRDYALLLVALHTGRRLSELAGMRREHLAIRAASVEITWPRCKGGKRMRDVLPRGRGAVGMAANALAVWIGRLVNLEDSSAIHQVGSNSVKSSNLPSLRAENSVRQVGRTRAQGYAALSQEHPIWISLAGNGTYGHALNFSSIADICEKRLGTRKVHALRHTFARALEDAGAKVSEIQAQLGHESLQTTGRYLARLHQGENQHLSRLSALYGLHQRDDGLPEDLTKLPSTYPAVPREVGPELEQDGE